jgi:transcriptional regulator with XRE-family HTH domain
MARADEDELKKVAHMVEWVAARIREIRESRGWSQAKLGVEMNIATTRIGDFERGRFEIKISSLFRLMRALGISPTEFFRGCPSWEAPKKGKKPS